MHRVLIHSQKRPYAFLPLLFAMSALFLFENSSQAEESRESWGWNGFVGAHGYSENGRLGSGQDSSVSGAFLVGARVWQRLGDLITVEVEAPMGVTTSRDQLATLFVTMPRIHGRLTPMPGAKYSPSMLFGGGASIVTSNVQDSVLTDIQPMAYFGLGLNAKLKGIRLGVEGRYVAVRGKDDILMAHEWEVLLSFGLIPNSAKPAPAYVPPPDKDRDGVPDDKDACPNRPEDKDGYEDEDGCPELDNDSDGVIDGLDECQGKPETYNGFKDDDGCPDEITDEVRLMEGVIPGLVFDAGSGVMEEDGLAELDKLVGILKANPSVRIELFGYGDDREAQGEELENIAQERADSVRDYLIEQGVGYGRIRAIGRGAIGPLADNETVSGRRFNRRVELKVFFED